MSVNTEKSQTLVWDVPVRVFHWLMVISFAGAYLSAESERWRLIHVTLGYTMGGLVVFRVVWGFVGSRYARFANFVRGLDAVKGYLKSLVFGKPEHYVGHNPAGAVAIVLLLLITLVIVASGFVIYNDMGGHLFEELHEIASNFMLLIVGIHIAGVLVASRLHSENLILAMVTGKKTTSPNQGIHSSRWFVALLTIVTTLLFWYFQWVSVPVAS